MKRLLALVNALKSTTIIRNRELGWDIKNGIPALITILESSNDETEGKRRYSYWNEVWEHYNLHGRKLHVSTKHLPGIFKSIDGDPQRRGIIGDIWVALSELLNFKMNVTTIVGIPKEFNDCTGMKGLIETETCMVKSAMGIRRSLLKEIDFTQCYFTSGIQLFTRPDYRFEITWIVDIFSPGLWSCIFLFYLLLICLSTLIYSIDLRGSQYRFSSSSMNAFFSIFATFCNQVADLEDSQKHRRILVLSISLFSWMMLTAHSSLLYIFMSKSNLVVPFHNLESLYYDTSYKILLADETAATRMFKEGENMIMRKLIDAGRVHHYNNAQSMWREACLSPYQSAAFHMAYQYATNYDHHLPCNLLPTGTSNNKLCIAAQIPKKFTFKEPINYGIIKLQEVGIITAIRRRWLKHETSLGIRPYSPIELGHLYLPIIVFISGFTMSVAVLIIEITILKGHDHNNSGR